MASEEEETEYLEDDSTEAELETELSLRRAQETGETSEKAEKMLLKVHISRVHIYRALPVCWAVKRFFSCQFIFDTTGDHEEQSNFQGTKWSVRKMLKSSKIDKKGYTLTTFINGVSYPVKCLVSGLTIWRWLIISRLLFR